MARPLSLTRIGIVLAVLAIPSLALADDLMTAGGYLFDIDEVDEGAITDGTDNAFDNSGEFWVDGVRYDVAGAAHTTSLGGRQIEMAEVSMSGLAVRRLVYVPSGGGDYARFLDVFENRGATDISTTIRYEAEVGGYNSSTDSLQDDSSGDTTFGVDDQWVVALPATSGAPLVGVVVQGVGGIEPVTLAERPFTDEYEWEYELTVPAGGRVALLSYSVQAATVAAAAAEASRLSALAADALVGLETYELDIANFNVSGAPVISITGPSEADEGAELSFEASVTDLEGDPVTWSWDLDGDGVFGELADMTSHTLAAGSTDGDSVLALAIEASDGTNTRVVTKTVRIHNVAPEITSEPPTMASGAEYQYQVMVDEPAVTGDPLVYRLGGSVPPGMTISAEGLITWTPPPAARGRTYTAVVQVLDGDHGSDVQTWEILVGMNTAPEPPAPVSPLDLAVVSPSESVTLVAANGSDPDGDALTYSFQISQAATFGASLIGSGDLQEGEDGMTSWTTTEPLAPGVWYWRVSVSDGNSRSLYRFGEFIVGEATEMAADGGAQPQADAGVSDAGPTAPPSGGCSAAPAQGGSAGLLLAMLASMVFFLRRREAN